MAWEQIRRGSSDVCTDESNDCDDWRATAKDEYNGPGPFDVNDRRPAEERGRQTPKTPSSLRDTMSTSTGEIGGNIQRPSTANSAHSRTLTSSTKSSRSGFGLPTFPRKNGYGGFGPPPAADEDAVQEILKPEQSSELFLLPNPSLEPAYRRPSEPVARIRRPSNDQQIPMGNSRSVSGSPPRLRKPSMSGPDRSRPAPPRGVSLIRPRTGARLGDAPPIPSNINLDAEFGIGNPYHTPSESQSSDTSGYSQQSKASSLSSPPSESADQPQREPSDKLDVLISEVQASMMDLQPTETPLAQSPEKSEDKEQFARGLPPPRNLDPTLLSPESPMDPAIQGGRLSSILVHSPAQFQEPVKPPVSSPVSPPKENPGTSPCDFEGKLQRLR